MHILYIHWSMLAFIVTYNILAILGPNTQLPNANYNRSIKIGLSVCIFPINIKVLLEIGTY